MKKVILATTLITSAIGISTQEDVFANENTTNNTNNIKQSRATILKGKVINVKSNDVLNVREKPNADSKLMFTLKNGEIVTVLTTESNGWYKIQKDSKTGYVNGRYLSTYKEIVQDSNTTATLNDAINLRNAASWSAEKLFVINKGEKVEVLSKGETWTKIKYNNVEGYAPTSYLDYSTSNDNQTPSTPNEKPTTPNNGLTETNYVATGKVIKVASNDTLNIRKEANGDSEKIGSIKGSTKVTILKKVSNGWYKILVNGVEGYVNGYYIEIIDTNPGTACKTNDRVNLRSEKSWDNTKILLTIEKDKTVYVLEKDADWARVAYDNTVGYVPVTHIEDSNNNAGQSPSTPSNPNKTEKIGTISVSGSLNVRSGPSTSYSILTKLYDGDTVSIIGESNGWYNIKTMTGITGWCSGAYVKNIKDGNLPSYGETVDEKVQSVIKVAREQIGKPYKYGATGPDSFDCSGLTSYVYKHGAGIVLPRTSGDQASAGSAVSRSSLKPGDLIFFNTSGSGISHVGIYIGNNEMIHAPSSGKTVSIAKITDSYWSSRYVTARRIIG